MATLYTDGKYYAVNTADRLVMITKAMYDCFIRQYELMGWKKETCGGLTHFFDPEKY